MISTNDEYIETETLPTLRKERRNRHEAVALAWRKLSRVFEKNAPCRGIGDDGARRKSVETLGGGETSWLASWPCCDESVNGDGGCCKGRSHPEETRALDVLTCF